MLTLKGYNLDVKPHLPLINVGTSGKPIYIPAEFCRLLPSQPLKAKLTPAEQAAMINFACRSPPENAQSVTTSARNVLALNDNPLLVSLAGILRMRLVLTGCRISSASRLTRR
jgi:eukaryotic translation initiation factor 2C